MNLADAIKKIKDTINAGVKPAENSFEDAVITVVENTGSGGGGNLPYESLEDTNIVNNESCVWTQVEV